MPDPTDSLRWRLRDATAARHACLDAQLDHAFDDPAGYAVFLQAMHRFVCCARQVIGDADDLQACEAALVDDLAVLGRTPLTSAGPYAGHEDARLGWRYVVAGSSLGARLLLRRAEALGFDATRGARYLALHARGDAWRRLLGVLESLHLDEPARRSACDGANAAFATVEQALVDARAAA